MSTRSSATSGELLDAGLVARPSGVASVRELLDPLPAGVGRVVDVRVMGGIDVELLPDRGLDVGAAWYHGTPLSWTSPVRRGTPLDAPRGGDWVDRFRGGLVTTCGTDNIGPATADAGMHGRHSHLPATDVRYERVRDEDATVVRVTGTVEDVTMFGRRVIVSRTVETRTDSPLLVLRDVVENTGSMPVLLPLLYHVNLGAPLVVPGSRVRSGAQQVSAREPVEHVPDASTLPEPGDGSPEAVFEHRLLPLNDGVASVIVASPSWDVAAVVSWTSATLPRLYQWVWPTRRGWALAVEPSSAALFGPDRGTSREAPSLRPGATLRTELSIRLVLRDDVPDALAPRAVAPVEETEP